MIWCCGANIYMTGLSGPNHGRPTATEPPAGVILYHKTVTLIFPLDTVTYIGISRSPLVLFDSDDELLYLFSHYNNQGF